MNKSTVKKMYMALYGKEDKEYEVNKEQHKSAHTKPKSDFGSVQVYLCGDEFNEKKLQTNFKINIEYTHWKKIHINSIVSFSRR